MAIIPDAQSKYRRLRQSGAREVNQQHLNPFFGTEARRFEDRSLCPLNHREWMPPIRPPSRGQGPAAGRREVQHTPAGNSPFLQIRGQMTLRGLTQQLERHQGPPS